MTIWKVFDSGVLGIIFFSKIKIKSMCLKYVIFVYSNGDFYCLRSNYFQWTRSLLLISFEKHEKNIYEICKYFFKKYKIKHKYIIYLKCADADRKFPKTNTPIKYSKWKRLCYLLLFFMGINVRYVKFIWKKRIK